MSATATVAPESGRDQNLGWIAGALVVLAVMAVGAGFWFKYHP